MSLNRRHALAVLSAAMALPSWRGAAGAEAAGAAGAEARARALASFLDGLGVERKWLAGRHVDWKTGEPDGGPVSSKGRHTHCSAFVASAAERLGIYILRPPEHGQVLLANAQNEWLPEAGAAAGWRPLQDRAEAQRWANRGWLVVASYHNHDDDKPGHIVIVRPGQTSADVMASDGPQVIQAGTVNSRSMSLRSAFAGHPAAWRDDEIEFFAHAVAWPRT